MKNYGRMHRAETMYATIYPYRDALKQDCPKKIQLILMVNRWINPWHAIQELSKEIPFKRRQKLKGDVIIELHHLHPGHDYELTRMKARIAELEEERRWRKCCEGLPLKGQRVLFLAKYKTDKVREWIGDFRHIDGMKKDFAVFCTSAPGWGCEFLIDEVIGWMPLPSAPKEEK